MNIASLGIIATIIFVNMMNIMNATSCSSYTFRGLIKSADNTCASTSVSQFEDAFDAQDAVKLGLALASNFPGAVGPTCSVALTLWSTFAEETAPLDNHYDELVNCMDSKIRDHISKDYIDNLRVEWTLYKEALEGYSTTSANYMDDMLDAHNSLYGYLEPKFMYGIDESTDYKDVEALLPFAKFGAEIMWQTTTATLGFMAQCINDGECVGSFTVNAGDYDEALNDLDQMMDYIKVWTDDAIILIEDMYSPTVSLYDTYTCDFWLFNVCASGSYYYWMKVKWENAGSSVTKECSHDGESITSGFNDYVDDLKEDYQAPIDEMWINVQNIRRGIVHLGCYADKSIVERGMPDYQGNGYSIDSCQAACDDYSLFALQYYGECWCGDDYSSATQYGESSSCPSNQLGAAWANDLFVYNPVKVYLGCYKDQGTRAVPDYKGNSYNVDSCYTACDGYSLFALQYGGECWCGDDYSSAIQYGESSECPDSRLGASWANDLFAREVTGLDSMSLNFDPNIYPKLCWSLAIIGLALMLCIVFLIKQNVTKQTQYKSVNNDSDDDEEPMTHE